MVIEPRQAKKYIEDGCSSCPSCGSTVLAINDPNFNKNKFTVKIDCYGCGQSYTEVYQISTIESVA